MESFIKKNKSTSVLKPLLLPEKKTSIVKKEEELVKVEEETEEDEVFEEEPEKEKQPVLQEKQKAGKKKRPKFWDKLPEFRKEFPTLSELQVKIIYYLRYFKSPFPRTLWNIANWLNSEEAIIEKELNELQKTIPIREVPYNFHKGYLLDRIKK